MGVYRLVVSAPLVSTPLTVIALFESMVKKIILLLVAVGALLFGYAYYTISASPAVPNDLEGPVTIEIPTGSSYEDVLGILAAAGIEPDRKLLDPLAERMAWKRPKMRSGRYKLEPGMSYLDLIRKLRNGSQEAVKVVLTTEREPMNVAAKVARFLEPDSLAFVRLFQNEAYLDSIGFSPETLQTLFIPNTYELYWNSSPREFIARMIKEHDRFWNTGNRLERARALKLSPAEVYTLASIVEKESLRPDERPVIAGLYLNRIRKGMRLEADPTAVFATREFSVGRVLNRHTQFDSPYNTYKNAGLPPGPITMASVGSIDAVLNEEKSDYIFMCARGDGSGYHNFAKTMAGHSRNIAVYVANLRARGIR